MEDNDNRRRLYDNLYKEFQLPEYNQFSEDMKDETKRKSLWENVGKEYQLPDFDKFSRDMGYEVQTTQQGNQNAQNAKKPQQTAQSSHVEEGRGLSRDNGYSKQKTAFDKAAEQAWNKLAHEGGIKWTIKGHPEVKMVAVTDDLVKKFPQLEQWRGYQVPFNMSTGTPIMQNIDDKGNIITPDEASEQYTKILTNQDFDYVPKQETAAVQIGSVVNTALSTKGGWLDRAVQKAMEESYGKDWKNRKYVSDGKEISSSEIYAKAKQGIYDNINGVLGDIRKSLLFSTDEQRRQTVDELYQKGYLKEDFLPKANALHYISNVDKGEQVEELRQRKLKLQVQREMVMDKLNQIPQPDHAENMAEFYARRANDGSELYASDLRKIDKQIAQYDAVIDELEGRNNLKSEWGHAVQTSGITDIGAWDFGITDLKDAMMMYPLARKMQNGENITQDDFMSLKLLAQANDADAVENAVMPSSYNMFKGSLQSVPFTVQFGAGKTFAEGAASVVNKAATRAVKGAILKAGGKKALRAAEKVAEKAAESKILKFCGMLGKDFEKAFVMENTTGAATTGAEILNRHIGTVTESDDGFKMEGESLPTAIIKGEISQNIESQTEFLGEHFPSSLKFIRGMAHTKVGSAMGLRNLAAWLTKVSRTEFATTLKSYATKAGINGVLGEYLEEVAGTAENALLVGDQKFSDLFDVKQQEEVAGSVVLSCLGMGIFGTAIYTGQRGLNMPAYYRLQHIQNKWDNAGLDLFTGEEWAKLKDRIDNTPNEGMKFVMADILRGQNMTEEQMRAAYNYASCTLTLRGMNLGAMKAAQLGLTDDRHIEQDNAYVEGRQAKDEDKHDIQIEFEDRSHELAEKLGISEQQLDNMSDEDLESLTGKDDQLDNLIYDYQTSHARYQGVVDNADDEIDKAAQEAARQTDMATDKSRGTVRNATIKAAKGEEDYGVYIVSGNVATNEDGSINVSESDDMILYYDPKSGKIEHCDAMRLAALGEEVNAEETRNQAIADAKEKAIRKQAGIIDGTVGEGTSFTITDAEGNEHTYEVLADNGDGSAMITMDGNVQDTPVSLQDLQNLKDAEEAKRLEAAKMQRQQYEEEREKQNAPVEDNLDYADIINTNGNVEIAEVVDEEGNAMFPDAEEVFFVQNQGNRAKVMVLDSEGNLQPKLVKKSAVRSLGTMSVDEYRQGRQQALKEAENASGPSLGDETEPSNNVVPTDNITTDNTTTDGTQPGNEAEVTTSDETQNISNEQENTPKITLEDGTEVPMLEDGNPDFSQLTAGQVAELYDSQFGEDAGQIITNNVNRSKKALDKANAMTVSGGSFVEQKASKEAKDKAIAEAKEKYDSAKAIADAYNERMLAKEEDTPEGRMNLIEKARRKFNRIKGSVKDNAQAIAQLYDETVGSLLHRLYDSTGIDVFDDTANTVDEYVASSIAPYSLNYEGTETSKGVKQETGLSRSDFAKTGLLAKEGKGKTIGQLANDLWRDRPSNLENITDQDVRNAIIDLITSGQTAFGLKNHIQNLRIAEAENVLEQQKRQADELAHAEKQKEEEQASTEQADDNTEESSNTEATPADAQEEDKLADMPFEAPSPDEDAPFSAKDKAKDPLEVWNNMTDEEKAAYIEKNRVKDTRLVDDVVGKKLRKAIEKIAEMMGATIQWQRTDMIRNGWFNPNTKTIYLALDSSILEGVQFVFGHEMTHEIKSKSPVMYDELKGLVKEKYGEELFEAMTNDNEKRYADVGKTDEDRSYYEEETVADAIGKMINDLNLTHSIALKMSHPLLAKMHDVLLKVKNALMATPYTDDVKGIIRTIEQVYVKTANGTFESSASEGTNDDENVSYSLRQKPEPEKKGTGYKVFVLGKDGKLYPPMVANPNGAATPVGVWLDADAAPVAGESKTGRPQVKQGGKGTQGGSGKLAYRPGWHLGVIPYAIQFNRKDAEGNKTLFPKNFVFAEVEYAADKDYQDEAHAEGINSNGKYQHSLAGLKHLPTDGYYMYRTNPNPETDPWVITGAMKVNRLLTRAEQADIVRKAGREPQQIQEGDIVTDHVVNSINQEIAAAPKFSLKVYHGSGADFTEFDFDHMGEGAGTQAFGWGGYVTSSKKIGKSYATLMDNDPSKAYYRIQRSNGTRFAKKYPTLESFLHGDKQIAMNDKFTEQEKIDYYNEMKKLAEPYHNLYEVDIPDDNGSNYLEWEKKPSNEVATKIIEGIYGLDDKTLDDMAARDIVFRTLMYDYIKNADKEQMIPILVKTNGLTRNTVYDNGNVEDDMRFVYNRLSNWMGSPKAASKFLSSLGFTGIKYPAGTIYGGAKEGDVNYVIFKPEDMQIVEHEKFSVKEGINRGYTQRENGDKISKNAYEAEEDGTYSHGTFKRKYKVAARTFPLLQQLGFITNTEWHHTGRNFSKTGFYTWADSDRISGGSISYADGKTQSGSIAAKYKENKQEIDDIVKGLPSKQWEFTKPESTETLSYEAWLSRKIPFREEDYLSKEEQAEKQANHERISADKSTPSYYRGESHKAVDQLYYNVAREHYQKELEDNRQQHEAEYKQYESEFPSKMQKLKEQNLGTNGKEKDLMRIYDLLGYKDSYGQVIKEISRPLATEDIDRVIGDGEKFSVKSKPVRFEIGKKLSDEEKKEVLSTLKDAYKVNGVPYHIEETAGGKEKRVYEPTFDSYVVSDITNRPLRYYITLPDGRVAHPTEIYPNISDNEVKSSATKQGLLEDEADQIVSAAIGNMKGIADNAKAVEVLTELQNLPHETHDIGYGLNNAQSYNYKTGIFTSDAAQAIDYVVRRMRRKEDVPAEIPAALKKAVADSYGMVDNLIDGMSNTKVGATEIKPVGVGAFGNIYNQFRGKAKAAIEFLKKLGNGEAAAALHHHTIGDISLVWGDKKTGLDKILRKHPEVIDNLQSIIDSMEVVLESDNRIKLESPTHFAVVSKEYKGEPREQWLLTAYEKRESLENGKSMDTATSSLGGDTALSQSKESAANIVNPSETSKGNAGKFSLRLQDAINETDTEPTEAQKKSGNYKKGHVKFGGYDYTIENPKGSYRSGVDENGKEWKQKMNDTYGYIRGKFGKDGDHLDMFINDKADLDSWNGDVFVVDQVNQDGTFDEHKVMYGYDSLDDAKKAYLSNYEKGWTGLGNITPVSKAGFDKWLDKSNRKLKPFADYADITSKTNMDTAPSCFEEFLEHPAVRYSIRNEKERAAAEDAYNFAQENRPDRYSRYAIVNMEKSGAVPQYLEKKAVADNWRRYYNKLKWGNYKLFDLDKPFEDNVKNLVGKFPETFRKKNDTTLSKINELTADYNKRKEEYDAMSNSIQELLNGLMKQGRSLAEAESVIRDWGLYKEMDSKYQNLMGIRKQLNELRSGKVADDERFSLIGKKGAEALDHAEEVSTRLDNLNVARQMEGAKKDAKAIKMATGWERGADGKWRYEIADSKLNDMMDVDGKGKMVKRHKEDMLWTSGKLGEVVVAPELFKAYPKLKNVRLETDSIMNNLPSNGEYNAETNTITIHADELKYLDSILNHEIQHAIQHIEGFARGGNPEYLQWRIEAAKKEWRARAWADALRDKAEEMGEHYNQVEVEKALIDEYKEMGMDNDEWMPDKETRIKGFNYFARGYADRSFDDDIRAFRLNESTRSDYNSYVEYTKLGGEVEARNVQSRMNMSPEERRKTLAEETEDVARKDQIFLYGDSVSMMGSRAFNEAINSSDNIRFSLKSMMEKPEGWKQANKKAIHIAEAIERDPKFSLKNLDGTLIKAGTYFSGGGLVEEGLKGIIDPVVAVEYDEKISGVYRNNFGNHIVTADVRDVDPKELVGKIDGEVEYFHASPVCKNYSLAKNNHEELELDKETAASTAEFISKVRPKVVTIENVKGYKDSEAMKTITDALDEAGYKWDADVYNAADYGGYTNRERLIVRAVRDGELPAKPEKQKRKSGW